MQENKNFDVIVIGSGISALTTASILSKINKKKVLILEQHSRAGGYTHVFSRKGYTWDVGFHYIGDIFNGKLAGKVLEFITAGKLSWYKTPEPFESFVYPDFTFNMFGDEKKFRNDLIAQFPEEKSAINSYFKDVKKVTFWYIIYYLNGILPSLLKIPLTLLGKFHEKLALMYTGEYLNKRFKSEKLKALIISQWGNYGLPPSQSAFMSHGLIVNHFIQGGYYPHGGSGKIAKSILPGIIENGGTVITNCKVTSIIVENQRTGGVEVTMKDKNEIVSKCFHAPVVISSAGAFNTFTKLLPRDCNLTFFDDCINLHSPSACVALYLGLKGDVKSIGFTGANCWVYESINHEACWLNSRLLEGKPSCCFISFPPPDEKTGKITTATVIAFTNYAAFDQWKHQKTGKRDNEYYKLKEIIEQGLLNFVNDRYPGFTSMIDYQELGTPLSAEDFTASPEGAMYGLGATPERYRQKWLSAKTPIKGLYLTGCDIGSLGIVPAMMSGLGTASILNGPFGFFKIVSRIRRACKKSKNTSHD